MHFRNWLKYSVIYYLLIISSNYSHSQELKWNLGFDGIADNREYFNSLTTPQTILGSRISGQIGFDVDNYHQIRIGLSYLYEFGTIDTLLRPDIIMYYHAKKDPYEFYMGAFPRKRLLNYPLALLTDTLLYFRPNIEGLYLKLYGNWGFENVWIDWTSRQTNIERETFLFGFSGKLNLKKLYLEHYFVMHHFAGPAIPIPNDHLRDNGGLILRLGLNAAEFIKIDSLTFTTGIINSIDRIRGVYSWTMAYGSITELHLNYKGYGINGLVYVGEGHDFMYGEGFYKAKSYGRTDLFFTPLNFERIHGRFMLSFHFIEGSIDNSQSFLVSINISK